MTTLFADADEGVWIGSRFGLEHLALGGRRSDVLRLAPDEAQTVGVNDLARCADGALYVLDARGPGEDTGRVYRITWEGDGATPAHHNP